MLKKKLGGGLLLSYDKVKKQEMGAKSGSVLPTTPRTKGILVIRKDGAPLLVEIRVHFSRHGTYRPYVDYGPHTEWVKDH